MPTREGGGWFGLSQKIKDLLQMGSTASMRDCALDAFNNRMIRNLAFPLFHEIGTSCIELH